VTTRGQADLASHFLDGHPEEIVHVQQLARQQVKRQPPSADPREMMVPPGGSSGRITTSASTRCHLPRTLTALTSGI
jgi:hypothetical protein